jgi:hypothetical protein
MSTLKVGGIRGVSASSDAITVANDGTCTANITNKPNRNLIINGAMQVAQRGTSSSSVNGIGCVDRFHNIRAGQDEEPTQAQHVLTSSDTGPYAEGFRFSFHVTNGNQSSGAGTNDYNSMRYNVEAQDLATSGWDYTSASSFITLSFWVKSSVAQNFYSYIKTNDGTGQNYPIETGSLTANTWTKITKTIPGNPNIQIDNDSGLGLQIYIGQFWGTAFTDSGVTLNQWATYASGTRMPDNTSTWWTTNDATFEITGVQLEVGSTATDFEHRPYIEELRRCQRYFFKGNFSSHLTAYFGGTHLFRQIPFVCPAPMRASPSFSLTGQTEGGGGNKLAVKTWSSDQNHTASASAIHMHHADHVHGTNDGAVYSVGLGIDFASSDSGQPPNGPGNHNVYACRVYGANLDAEF